MQTPLRRLPRRTPLLPLAGLLITTVLAGCGYKGSLYLPPPPPPPAQSLTLPPTPGNAPVTAQPATGPAAQPSSPAPQDIKGK